jgi:hypothetical protein
MALTIQSGARINSLFWIKSLNPRVSDEEASTQKVLADLEPYLKGINVPFTMMSPKSRAELVQNLAEIELIAKSGGKPMIHIDTHGNKDAGIYIFENAEFVGWNVLKDSLRRINIATGNNLCVISAACFGFHQALESEISEPSIFYLLIGPEEKTHFHFVESALFAFYKQVFDNSEIIDAFETHLKAEMRLFHSEQMLVRAMSDYFVKYCMGDAAEQRVSELLARSAVEASKMAPEKLEAITKQVRKKIEPSADTFQKYAEIFLIGKSPGVTFEEVMEHTQKKFDQQQRYNPGKAPTG